MKFNCKILISASRSRSKNVVDLRSWPRLRAKTFSLEPWGAARILAALLNSKMSVSPTITRVTKAPDDLGVIDSSSSPRESHGQF